MTTLSFIDETSATRGQHTINWTELSEASTSDTVPARVTKQIVIHSKQVETNLIFKYVLEIRDALEFKGVPPVPWLALILEIDNYLKHTEIALFRCWQYIMYMPNIVWPFGQRYFLDTWWNKSSHSSSTCCVPHLWTKKSFLFQQASLS